MIKNRPRGRRFHQWLLSRNSTRWVNKLIWAIDKRLDNYDDIQGNDQYIGITSKISRPTPACIYYYYSTHRPLSSMHLVYFVHGETKQCNKNDDMMQTTSIHVGIAPILLSLIATIHACLAAPFVTGKEHRTIKPITKHLFPWQEKSIQLA